MEKFDESVRSVERALRIIETLSQVDDIGITDMSRELGLNKATVYRLVTTLRIQGYVEQVKEDKYKLTFKIFELGSNMVNRLGIRKTAYPFLEELAAITKETVNLGALEETHVCYIERIESREALRLGLDIGARFPSHCTALGRVMLAYLEPGDVDNILQKAESEGQLQQYTAKTITDKKLIKAELYKIRKQGYAIETEQYLPGIRCIAAPIFNHTEKVIAAISVAGPSTRVNEELSKTIVTNLTRVAKELSARLGYRPRFTG